MRDLGFDGYALDHVDCPAGMHWFLKRELNLHRTAINLNGRVDVNRAMNMVARVGGGANFTSGSSMNTVTRSRYGKRALGNMTRDIKPARNLVASTVDPEVKRRLDDAINESRQAITIIESQRAEIDAQHKIVMAEDSEILTRLNGVKARRDAARDALQKRRQQEHKLKTWNDHLQELLNAPPVEQERARLKKKLLNVSKSRVQIARDYTAISKTVVEEQMASTRAGLEHLQAGANKAALEALCQVLLKELKDEGTDAYNALEETRGIITEAEEDLRKEYDAIEAARTAYDKQLNEARDDGSTPPSAEGVDLRSLDELEAELQTQQTNLDLNLQTNPGIVEQYEKRKRDIEALEKAIDDRKKKAEKVERNIKNARDNWKPALEKLVASIGSKFSAAFDRIGCAGEIRISEHDDYDKWAIDILVKFRDSEKLQLLTSQRQSGGERSLTTILYLMSLTEEARAPFSLVDEINQGMDQRAERMVHNSMVEVTCKPDSAQYFLITPKLLPDLMYHDRMKILCVNNGEWLPDEKDLGNMMNMIEGWVQRNRGAASSAL
ncbi:hypothetical protein BDN72DRAFT_614626 [Pluteus cervinus]|uniref:Uncharacterized protein n=1 Tax=Pluteus cervinus TaxID=181527 RepID=A0ACD3AUJ8_9AGAR|nr:hypothetical protein BDN72DRAFT_614626 [Pluteus cervinus]